MHIPAQITKQYPYLRDPGVRLDKDPNVQEIFLEYVERVTDFYLRQFKEVASIQIENEPFSKYLAVSDGRHISPKFNERELEIIQKHNFQIPILQNFPMDFPSGLPRNLPELLSETLPHLIKSSDMIGFNIYNQASYHNDFSWEWLYFCSTLTKLFGKKILVTEYQGAPCLLDGETAFPFSSERRLQGLHKIKKEIQPEITFLWDLEQLLSRGKEHLGFLDSVIKTETIAAPALSGSLPPNLRR